MHDSVFKHSLSDFVLTGCFCLIESLSAEVKLLKGRWRMPGHWEAMKDVLGCEKLRVVA